MTTPFIQRVRTKVVSFPFKKPFVTAKGRKSTTHNVAVWIDLQTGITGYGEASTSLAFAHITQADLLRVIRTLTASFPTRSIASYPSLLAEIWKNCGDATAAAAAIECALLDAYTQTEQTSLVHFFGGRKKAVETDLTFSIRPPAELYKEAIAASRKGFRHFKVKLSGDGWIDLERLAAVHAAAPRARLVADGNQGFTVADAVRLSNAVYQTKLPVYFFEQPFPRRALAAMRTYRKKAKLPLVADESVFCAREAIRLFESGAADGINLKVAKSGLLQTYEMAQIAKRYRKILSIGCMEESKRGLAASVHLACGLGSFDWVDLDSAFLLKETREKTTYSSKKAFLVPNR